MSNTSCSNIMQLLSSIDKFIQIYENPSWIAKASAEDVKTSFKLTLFIEKAMNHFEIQNTLSHFSVMLNSWCESQKKAKVYDTSFLNSASDHLLENIFKNENITEAMLDTGIRIYTSIYKKDRLANVLKRLILHSQSKQAITEFIRTVDFNEKSLGYTMILKKWSEYYQQGKKSIVTSQVKNYLSLYKVENMLHLLIGILSVEDASYPEKEIQQIVLECVLEKMLDRSIMSKSLWITLFKKVDKDTISKACASFRTFLMSLLNFIIYIGSLMKSEQLGESLMWKSDELICFCPEIGYYDLLYVLDSICSQNNSLQKCVFDRFDEVETHSDLLIWNTFKNEILNIDNS